MAAVTDTHCSEIAHLIIEQLSKFDCNNETDGIAKIQNYIQQLKRQYNKNLLEKYLTQVVNDLDDKYYNDGTSPLTDIQYDCFIETLKTSRDKVGADVSTNVDAVKLPYFMASMNKCKTIAEVKTWSSKFRGPYTVTAKLDGVSAMYYRGKLYTRGNGSYGRDISYLIPLLNQKFPFPREDYEFALRGELIIRKSIFAEKYSCSFANSRNLVCGLLNRVYCKENEEFYNNIDFVTYDVYYHNPLQFCNKINIIQNSGTQMVIYNDKIDSDKLNNLILLDTILKKWKLEYDYEIDGIIITNDKPCIHSEDSNPDFAFAYKNNVIGVEMKEAVVDKVIWNVSKDNYLKPKIKLQDKVECDGSQIEYVTGFNAKYILQNNIKNGTIVKIGLSGNVIPHIFEIVDGSKNQLTQHVWEDLTHPISQKLLENIEFEQGTYGWNKNKVDLISTKNHNHLCIIKKNMIFFKSFNLKCGLQETTLINLHKSLGIYKLEDVLSLNVEQWEQVEKVGTKKGEKIVNALKSTLDWDIIDFMLKKNPEEYFMNWLVGLQCFPRGFGKKKLESHIKYLRQVCDSHSPSSFSKLYQPDYFAILVDKFVNKTEEFKTPQVTSDSIQLFCQKFSVFIDNYNSIKSNITNIELPTLQTLLQNITENENDVEGGIGDAKIEKKGNIVFSGVRDKEKESYYLNQGYEISDSVNSKTKLLIVKDKTKVSSKMKKAVALGVPITSLNQL